MNKWPPFENSGTKYDLSHLDARSIIVHREASDEHPEKTVRIFIKYSDHCFTDHHGDDESWVYPYTLGTKERYFSKERHEYSLELPKVILRLFHENLYLKRTFNDRREQFFHLDGKTLFLDYRVFLEINKFKNESHDIWIKVISAYPENNFANSVGGDRSFRIWRIIDARMDEAALPSYGRRRRRR